jgi:hypothetical protein
MFDTDQAVAIIKSAGETIKALAEGYDKLNQELNQYESADQITDAALAELKQIAADNAILTSGPSTEVGEVVVDNPTPAADGVIKVIDEMPIDLPAGGVVETATDKTVDTTAPTTPAIVTEAIEELITAIEESAAEPALDATAPAVESTAETVADPSNPTVDAEGNLFR